MGQHQAFYARAAMIAQLCQDQDLYREQFGGVVTETDSKPRRGDTINKPNIHDNASKDGSASAMIKAPDEPMTGCKRKLDWDTVVVQRGTEAMRTLIECGMHLQQHCDRQTAWSRELCAPPKFCACPGLPGKPKTDAAHG